MGDGGFPFKKYDPSDGRFFDPQADYDPIRGRLWMIYSEDNATLGSNNRARIHVALTKNPALFPAGGSDITSLGTGHWWYFTGNATASPPTVRDGEPLDFGSTSLKAYQNQSGHSRFLSLADRPTMAFDERAVILTPWSYNDDDEISTSLFVILITHTSGSILDGDRPDESDITVISLSGDGLDDEDFSLYYMSVQEPFDQFENKTFFINDPNDVSGVATGIRLCGLYWDDRDPPLEDRWQVRQKTVGGSLDIPFDSDAPRYHRSGPGVRTPDSGWSPPTPEGHIHTAVLVRDANNDPRIFAAHAVNPDDDGTRVDQIVVQWYVIDPDLTNFETTSWNPTFDAIGRIDHGDTTGDHYHPVIGVTEQGVAYIEYTYSDANTWPQVRRVTLNSTYTGIVPNSEVVVQTGPTHVYDTTVGGWADFAEMQADPVTGCAFWSVHTLVHAVPETPELRDQRDVWLFQSLFNCGNSNLNFDAGTDLYDLALFNSYYATGARRVDMNTDGTTDAADAAIYADEYDMATWP